MVMSSHCRVGVRVAALVAASIAASAIYADEIRLKDGKKLYGVIVAYEDNMFKVKTDFGYVLVEKDKIAQIIPSTPATSEPVKPPQQPQPAAKPSNDTPVKAEPAVERSTTGTGAAADTAKREKTAAVVTHANARPEIHAATPVNMDTMAPALKNSNAAPKAALSSATAAPPPPKEEPAPIKEEIQGNLYINHEFGFRLYKAPSWQIIDGAGQTLPNAIVAMGTSNESTLMVIGREKTKATLESAAKTVETRMRDVYENYRLISERKTVVSGMPAVEYKYRGMADGHDWSGTLAVVSRSGDIFTILGMTFAETDLIQIQENVITRSIASMDLNAK